MSLIIFFLIKEGGMLTGWAACLCAATVLGVFAVFYLIIGAIVSAIQPDWKGAVNETHTFLMRASYAQLVVLWHICVNMSTLHRIFVMIHGIFVGRMKMTVKVCAAMHTYMYIHVWI